MSVPPTAKLAVPVPLNDPVAAEGEVVKVIEAAPLLTVPPVVEIAKVRFASPVTAKPSAELALPLTNVTSPEAEPEPEDETVTEPPVPVVNLPKLSEAPLVCCSVIGAITVAVAVPEVVAVFPAANAGDETRAAETAAMTNDFILLTLFAGIR